MDKAIVERKLQSALSPTHLVVTDLSDGCGMKFDVVVVSEKFQDKPLLQRHRLVNKSLEEEMRTIHALTMKTYTPEQWEEQVKGSE